MMEEFIQGIYFKVTGLDGNAIITEDEYKKNNYTVLVQLVPNDSNTLAFIPVLVSLYHKYAAKKVDIIGWAFHPDSAEEFRSFVKKQNIPWRNFYSGFLDNRIWATSCGYPAGEVGLTVHVVNSNNCMVFSSMITDVNTLPDFFC